MGVANRNKGESVTTTREQKEFQHTNADLDDELEAVIVNVRRGDDGEEEEREEKSLEDAGRALCRARLPWLMAGLLLAGLERGPGFVLHEKYTTEEGSTVFLNPEDEERNGALRIVPVYGESADILLNALIVLRWYSVSISGFSTVFFPLSSKLTLCFRTYPRDIGL